MIKFATRCSFPLTFNSYSHQNCKSFQNIVCQKLTHSSAFYFAKLKKEKPELKVPSINISKFSEQDDGFVLYNNTEGGRFKVISIAFLLYFMWGGWMYNQTEDQQIKINYLIMGSLMVVSFLVYQFRVNKTLKKMILDKSGQNVVMARFRMGGFAQERTKARVQVLRGIGKAFVFGGSVIKGGGIFGLQQRNYWFQSKFITEPIPFEEVAQGRRLKVDRTKIY